MQNPSENAKVAVEPSIDAASELSFESLKPRLAALDKEALAASVVALLETLVAATAAAEPEISRLRRGAELNPERLPALAAGFRQAMRIRTSPEHWAADASRIAKTLSDLDTIISAASQTLHQVQGWMAAAASDPANIPALRDNSLDSLSYAVTSTLAAPGDAASTANIPAQNGPRNPEALISAGAATQPRSSSSDVDALTGLPGRASAQEMLEHMLDTSAPCHIAVFVLDRLRIIKDKYGTRASEQVLLFFGQHLAQQLTASNNVFRWSPTAFVVVFTEPLSRQQVFDQVREVALSKLLKSLELQNRSVLVQITSQWKLLAVGNRSTDALFRDIDQFVSAPQPTRAYQD